MKKPFLLMVCFVIVMNSCRTTQMATVTDVVHDEKTGEPVAVIDVIKEKSLDFRDASTWLLGDFKHDRLLSATHFGWYSEEFDEYNPNTTVTEELKKTDLEGITLTIVLGTWCPDSRREVPRFMKIADQWGFPTEKIRFIGVDINKVAPLDDYLQLGIERVPTFIFFKNNIELGRIIEVPVTSLEQDTRNILIKK